jgi:hypothetical protein
MPQATEEKTHHCGVIVFDLRAAETPDDEAIEKLVQLLVAFVLKEAKDDNLAFPDVMCAAIEFAARMSAAATTFHEPDEEKDAILVADLTNNFRNRMLGAMEGRAPGEADAAKPQ